MLTSISACLVWDYSDQSFFRALIGRNKMQTIQRYPIYPSSAGMTVLLPDGSQLLCVSLSIHTYYLHALCNKAAPMVERRIIALQDDHTYQDIELGQYLGRCEQSGDVRGWHFFAPGGAL